MLRARAVGSIAAAAVLAAMLAVPTEALALTSVEGAIIGDQGYYWHTPSEGWIFPHRIGNIDNRVMLQYGTSTPVTLYNLEPIQRLIGGGFIMELADSLNLGLWVSEYTPGMAGFVTRGAAETDFDDVGGRGSVNELPGVDAYTPAVEAGRKLDLFASYWLPAASLEAGLRLWYGSGHHNQQGDDSTGPIDIDTDSNTATPGTPVLAAGADIQDAVTESKFGLSEFGLGLGAGWAGIEGMRLDVGVQFSRMGVSWEPNGVTDYVDAGGTGLGLDARAHYDLSDKLTVGGFLRFHRQGMHFEPKMQRDGGELEDFFAASDPTTATPSPGIMDPPTADPADPSNDAAAPLAGMKYEENRSDVQLAGLARFRPNSRATLYTAVGFYRQTSTNKTSIGSDWSWEETTTTGSLPFIHLGFEGAVFRHLNVFLGASKRWQGEGFDYTGFDQRIPDDGNVGPGGPPAAGDPDGDNTNANRREYTTTDHEDLSDTNLFLGTRIRYGGLELVGALDPGVLNRGLYFLSGAAGPAPWFWVSLVYDWDYDADKKSGNGSGKSVPNGAPTGKETFES